METFVNYPTILFFFYVKTKHAKFKLIFILDHSECQTLYFFLGRAVPVCGRWCGPRPEGFWFPLLLTNLPSFPNDAGEHPLNITQGFPWRQGSELAMVMVMNLEWVVSSLLKYPLQNFIFVAGLLYVPLSHLFYLLLLHSNL